MPVTENEIPLSTKEAAQYLGLSESSLRKGRIYGSRNGRISPPPFYRTGRAIRYKKADLEEWLHSHRVNPSKFTDSKDEK